LQAGGQLVDPFRNGRAAQVLAPYNVGCFGAALGDPVFTLYEPQKLELMVYASTGKCIILLANGQPDIQVDFFHSWLVVGWLVGWLVAAVSNDHKLHGPPKLSTIIFWRRSKKVNFPRFYAGCRAETFFKWLEKRARFGGWKVPVRCC
jgi:uncharacterized membrane protein YeaQ/YmgE (transglycosylase-associated protein family)